MSMTLTHPRVRRRFEARAEVVKALAHPTRLFLMDELSRGERCVCELTELVGADMSTVSKHLAVLRAAGLVANERRGAQVFYSVRVPCMSSFFSRVEGVIEENAARLRAAGS